MIKPLIAILGLLVAGSSLHAAEKASDSKPKAAPVPIAAKAGGKAPAKTAKPPKGAAVDVDVKDGLDIIGSQDAPLELNIVPWKDKDNVLPKNPLEASFLNETLEPVDRDVVKREVDYSRALHSIPTPTP